MVKINVNTSRTLFSSPDLVINQLKNVFDNIELRSSDIEALTVNVVDHSANVDDESYKYFSNDVSNTKSETCSNAVTVYRGRETHDLVIYYKPCNDSLMTRFSNTSKLFQSENVTVLTNNILHIKTKKEHDYSTFVEFAKQNNNLSCDESKSLKIFQLLMSIENDPFNHLHLKELFTMIHELSFPQLGIWIKIMKIFEKMTVSDKFKFFSTIMSAWESFDIIDRIRYYDIDEFIFCVPERFKMSNQQWVPSCSCLASIERYDVPSVIQYMAYFLVKQDLPKGYIFQYVNALVKFVHYSKMKVVNRHQNRYEKHMNHFLNFKNNEWIYTPRKFDSDELIRDLERQFSKNNIKKAGVIGLLAILKIDDMSEIGSKFREISIEPVPIKFFV